MLIAGIGGYIAGYSIGAGSGHGLLIGIIGIAAAASTVHTGRMQKPAARPAVEPPEPGTP